MIKVKRLLLIAWLSAYPIIKQLRQLELTEFITRVKRQSFNGYELIGAYLNGGLVGVMGIRFVHTLAPGEHLHID